MKYKRLLKNIVFYSLGTFSTKILQLLFVPLYTIYISTDDFGYYNLVLSITMLTVPLLYQSIWEGILRFIIEDRYSEKKIISTTNIYCIGLTIVYGFLYLILWKTLQIKYGALIFLMAFSQMGVSYWQFSARALKKNFIYSISTIANAGTTIAMNFLLIVVFKTGLLGLFIANSIGNIIMIIILEGNLKLLNRTNRSEFDKELLKTIIKYSIPLSINAASWWLISSFNNLVITYKIGMAENGIYSMANRFGTIMSLVTTVVNMAWLEEAFRIHGEDSQDEYFNMVLDMFIRLLLSGVVVLIPITYIFYQLFIFGEYTTGVILTPIIYMNAAFSAIAAHLGSGFLARKESNIIFKTTLIGGVISALGGYIVAEPFGAIGVVLTSLLGSLIMFAIRIPLLKKRINLSINYSILLSLTMIGGLVMFISQIYLGSLTGQIVILLCAGIIVSILNRNIILTLVNKVKNRVVK